MTKALLVFGEGEKVEVELDEIGSINRKLEAEGKLVCPRLYY